jgi:hypothetical protein
MVGDRSYATNHNVEILHSVGFKKQNNTSIFRKGDYYLISPAVSCGAGHNYWFDIREVNKEKIQGTKNPHILIRVVPDMFILIKFPEFLPLLSQNTKRYRKHSGEVWGFYTSLNTTTGKAKIISTADSTLTYTASIIAKNFIINELESIN